MFHEKYAYVRYRADENSHDSYVRTIEGGRGSEQRDLPQSPGQPQPPQAISIIDSTRFKTACVSIRRSPTLALRPPFPPSKTHPGFFLFPSRWRTRRDAIVTFRGGAVAVVHPADAIPDSFDRLSDSRLPILGYSFVNTCGYTL